MRWFTTATSSRLLAVALTSMLLAVRVAAATLQVGAKLPDISLPDAQGHSVALASLRAPVVIVEFWASWCPLCREALPAFSALAKGYGPQVQLVAINIDHDPGVADQWLERNLPGRDAVLLFDSNNRVMADWGAPGMPSVYVVVGGIIRQVHAGYGTETYEAVHRMLQDTLQAPAADGRGHP